MIVTVRDPQAVRHRNPDRTDREESVPGVLASVIHARDLLLRRSAAVLLAATLPLAACLPAAKPVPPAAPAAGVAAAPEATAPRLPDWRDAVLYFALLDRFADGDLGNDVAVNRAAKGTFHGGDLKGLRAHLDEIATLGVTALWITPVVKNVDGFVTGAGFPDWAYHGYWPDDFTRLDRRFGTEEDLRGLVEDCHRRGIRVLLDVVYNHAGYNSRYATDPGTRSRLRLPDLGQCGTDDLTTCVSGLPDFRTEDPAVADFVMTPQIALAKRVGIDGFRLDTVKHVDHPFWDEHRKRTRAVRADFFLLGEVWGGDAEVLDPWFAPDELDAGFDFGFQGSTLGWVSGRGRTVAFDRYLRSRDRVRDGHLLSHFLSSHDVPGALHQLGGDKELFRLAAVMQMTSRGIPMIYYGEEVGRPGGDWPDNRSDMPWGNRDILPGKGAARDEGLRDFYRKLVAIRKAHPALSRAPHETVSTEGDLLVFLRRDAAAGDVVMVAANRGAAAVTAPVPVPDEWKNRGAVAIVDELQGGQWTPDAGAVRIDVPPRSARILAVPPR